MSDDILNTIEVLTKRVVGKEEEANKLKKLVNELCAEAAIAARYPNIVEAGVSIGAIRPDQYYGQPLTAAIRSYLEQRKASGLGAAALTEIYSAIRDGGYKFETKSEDIAQISVGNTLRKSSSIFHRLPNGQYGLLTWYPSAKAKPETEVSTKKSHVAPDSSETHAPNSESDEKPEKLKNDVTNKEIRGIILEQSGQFQSKEIEALVRSKYPSKDLSKTKIPSVIFLLKRDGFIKTVSEGSGSKGSVYAKA
jgi:hypothetical protein